MLRDNSKGRRRTAVQIDTRQRKGAANLTDAIANGKSVSKSGPSVAGGLSASKLTVQNTDVALSEVYAGSAAARERNAATVSSNSAQPNVDDVDARMAKIEEILGHAAMHLLDRCALIAEWVHHAEAKLSDYGQVVWKPKGGRPEGGVARAARELRVPGKTPEARRKYIERAIKIEGVYPEAKSAACAAGLDDIQSALLAIARGHSLKAQLAKVEEIAARKAAPRRKSAAREDGDSTAKMPKASAAPVGAEVHSSDGMHVMVGEEVESPSTSPQGDDDIPAFLDRRPLSPDDQRAFDAIMAVWTSSGLQSMCCNASAVVRERFTAEIRAITAPRWAAE
jgi:hypothetical protein